MLAGFTSLSFSEYVSPRAQLQSGVLPEDIQCRDDRLLVLRTNGNIACVSERTAERIGWKIIKTSEITNVEPITSTITVLDLSSPIEFVDDGREIQFSILQKSPAPWPIYDRIMTSMEDGMAVSSDGVASITSSTHEKYSINPGVGFYAEDWLPDYIPEGQKLLYTETGCYEKSGDCGLGIHFVPTTFVLNENVTSHYMQVSKGFVISIKNSVLPLNEIEDLVEFVKEIYQSQPGNFGLGFVDMTRDGKNVFAFEGGNLLNHYRASISFHPDENTSVGVLSHYHTLDELIPIFESILE